MIGLLKLRLCQMRASLMKLSLVEDRAASIGYWCEEDRGANVIFDNDGYPIYSNQRRRSRPASRRSPGNLLYRTIYGRFQDITAEGQRRRKRHVRHRWTSGDYDSDGFDIYVTRLRRQASFTTTVSTFVPCGQTIKRLGSRT